MTKQTAPDSSPASQVKFEAYDQEGDAHFRLEGRLDRDSVSTIWDKALSEMRTSQADPLVISAEDLDYCDGAGIALLAEMYCIVDEQGRTLEFRDLQDRVRNLLDQTDFEVMEQERKTEKEKSHALDDLGEATWKIWSDLSDMVQFFGRVLDALTRSLLRPLSIRWRDTWYIAETAGANTLPIVLLIAFIVGLVMAFQAAMPMRNYGAEIFVTDLIVLSMLRELGPLMTAIILAGRSGSAFAAEIGTMQINEEIDALTTMGIDPVRFLVVPRVIAATLVTPLLTLYANAIGIVGGAVVLLSLGHPITSYWNRANYVAEFPDFWTGLLKSFVFGFLVAWIGCLRGLQTRTGASGVGKSTTRAVVSAIVLIAIADAIFSVIFYVLEI